ncbi:MAG: serine/threonine-protein kinase, partial [Planctomycetales bacterium]|nr:serine/threonine-protein kinase [Planctomycetales bacterium]
MVPPSDDSPKSLGDGATGSDVEPSEPSSPQSVGDQSTTGDMGSSISDLADVGEDFGDGSEEIVDLEARYEIQKTLGIGGMGEVVLARDKRLNRQVAIKRLKEELGANRKAAQRFLTEAQSVAALNHFNIVQIYDYGRATDGPFIVMEYVGGGSLAEVLTDGEPLELERVIELGSQLCEAIGVAHQAGIIHRDIKPANVLMTAEGMPKLTDFGLARQETVDGGQTQAGAVLGTLDFMPPEQKVDATQTDARSDLWSVGATIYQMATGKSPRVIRLHELPGGLQEVLGKALEDAPGERYQTGGEFRDALRTAGRVTQGSATLSEGECPGCGESNPHDLKFCRHCGETLEPGCLSCQEPMGVWSTFCGACGTSVEDALSDIREQLDVSKQEIETLGQGALYAEAIEACGVLGETDHPQLAEYAEWSSEMVVQLQEEQSRRETERGELLAAARASYADHADRDVLQLLERVPEPLRDEEVRDLLEQATVRTTRSRELKEALNRAITAKDYDGLLPQVQEYLGLRPQDDAAVQLLEQLKAREGRHQARLLSTSKSRVKELVGELRHQEALTLLKQLSESGRLKSAELRSWVETTRTKVRPEYA